MVYGHQDGELAALDVVANCLTVPKMAMCSQSKVLYFLSALVSFLEEKNTGHQMPSRYCSS